jgi:hypothetical protein
MRKGLLRRDIGVSDNGDIMAPKGLSSGGDGFPTIVSPSWNQVAFFDDFVGIYPTLQNLGDTGLDHYYNVRGTDTGRDNGVEYLTGGPTAVRLTAPQNFPVSNGGGAPDMQGLVLGRNFAATQGRVRFVARLRNADTGTTPNGVSIFAGFTDDTGTTEVAFYVDTGEGAGPTGEISAKATNAVGWLYDTIPDTGSGLTEARWCGVAVNADAVSAPVIAARGLTPNVWDIVEVVVDNGQADFWLYDKNGAGTRVGRIAAPVAATSKLVPVVSITGHQVTTDKVNRLDVDFLHVSANRDTGT